MPRLIKHGAVLPDRWRLLRDAAAPADLPHAAPAIVPLASWLDHRDSLRIRGDVGVWLAPHEDPYALAADVAELPLIAVDFPQFTDGRGYSIAHLLREPLGFRGELRAIGDVQRDQLFALAECGFDAFALRADGDATAALADLAAYRGVYAPTARTPQPRFRRRCDPSAVGGTHGDVHAVVAVPPRSN
jgi:uncharacterized protein (DUF934 family)